jgi:hypothetical protein
VSRELKRVQNGVRFHAKPDRLIFSVVHATRFILQRRTSLGIVELMEQRLPDRIQHALVAGGKPSVTSIGVRNDLSLPPSKIPSLIRNLMRPMSGLVAESDEANGNWEVSSVLSGGIPLVAAVA